MFFFLKHANENAALSTKQSSILKSHYSTYLTTEALSLCELECIRERKTKNHSMNYAFFFSCNTENSALLCSVDKAALLFSD